jgi:alpha-glucosidase
MRAVVDEFPERVLIGEIYLPVPQLMTYYGVDLRGANLPFNFQLLQCAWSAVSVAEVISEYQRALPQGAWPNWVLGNHDTPRIASRVGARQARVASMLLLTLPGTITMYYGEELGMCNVPIQPDQVQDPFEKNEPGLGLGRDPERTPMPWDGSPTAGFTNGWPWLPLGDQHEIVNVAARERDDNSILSLYRNLIQMRETHRALVSGKLECVMAEKNVLRYARTGDNESLLVMLNMAAEPVQIATERGTILVSTHMDRERAKVDGRVDLRGAEGLIIRIDP